MLTTLPRLRDTKGISADILPRLASDRRKKISQVGKVFPKTFVQEKVDEKLDFHCVGLDVDKNVSFPDVVVECSPSSHGTEVESLSPLETGDGTEVTLPELPSILGSRRSGTTPSPDVSEPLDLLIKGEARKKSDTQVSFDGIEELPVMAAEEVMRANLKPLIDTLFEEDELFAQDFEQDGLDRVLFIRRMGIYVEIKTKDYIPGIVCTPLFHCQRCKDHWIEFGTVPENCQFARKATRGPAIHLASNRKPRSDARKRKTKRRLGDIKEGFIVSGSGTVLNQIDHDDYEGTIQNNTFPQPRSNRTKAHFSSKDVPSRDYLTSDEVNLEDLNLQEIDSTTMMEAFKEIADAQKLDKETYFRTVAEALGFNEDQCNDFVRANVNKTTDKSGGNYSDLKTPTSDTTATTLGTADAQKLHKETSVGIVAGAPGFQEDECNDFSRINVNNTAAKSGENWNNLKTFASDTTATTIGTATTASVNTTRYNSDTTAATTGTGRAASMDGKPSSFSSILTFSTLQTMTVKDLPERIRTKLLSLLRSQRMKRQRQAYYNNKKRTPHIGDSDSQNPERYKSLVDNELCSKDVAMAGNGNGRRDSVVKTNRRRRDSRGKQGRVQGQSMDHIDDSEDTPEGMTGFTEGAPRATSASGRRYSITTYYADSDEESFPTSGSPSEVLAYRELQSQQRSRKKNKSVKNRTGQPDTPIQRLGRHSISIPSTSTSFYSNDDGDHDYDEENWGQGRAPRMGSSRARMSDSHTSYMSDMARGPHVSDSRTSMLRKYSRAMGSAHARKDVSFNNLDDQLSYGSGNEDSIYDLHDDGTGTRSNRARRSIRKKEKGDNAKRPGHYHSKVIQDMALGHGSPSMSHMTASFCDANMTYGSNARLSLACISLTEVTSDLLSCDSTMINKRSVRPVSSVKPSQKRKKTPEPECAQPFLEVSTAVEVCPESTDELPLLEAAIPEDSVTTHPAQAQEKQSEKLFKRVERSSSKPLILLEDLNVMYRLPVSSAFTFSFYELPNQHREHNQSIKKASGRIGGRKKKESDHFRSRSAP